MNVYQQWLDLGLDPIPLRYRSKKPKIAWLKWTRRDIPRVMYKRWFSKLCNVGVLMKNGIVVLDFDSPVDYDPMTTLPKTLTIQTKRGFHFYYRVEMESSPTSMEGGDVKTSGYVVTAPSIHPQGYKYKTLNHEKPLEIKELRQLEQYGVVFVEKEIPHFEPGTSINGTSGIVEKIKFYIPIINWLSEITTLESAYDDSYVCCCPFHDDKNPSMQVFPSDERCFCHSTRCRAHRSMDVIDCFAMYHNVSVQDAIQLLSTKVPE